MRIAVVTTSYPCYPGDGAGHFVRAEALELASQGHEVQVIAPAPEHPHAECDPGVLRLWSTPHGGAFGWPGAVSRLSAHPWRAAGAVAFMTLARARLRSLCPERVVAHWIVPCAHPIALSGAPDAELQVVAHGADVRALLRLPAVVRQRILASLLQGNAHIRFVAHALRDSLAAVLPDSLRQRLAAQSSVRPASLGVPDVSERARALRRACNKPIMVTAVGRMVPSKRIDLAISAANLLHPSVHLNVVGDGPELRRLRALDQAGNVTFLGQVQRDEALAWIAASEVLVHASCAEAAPTVVREARTLGTPVVACAAGDLERWATEDPGIRLVRATPRDIAHGVHACCGM
ncbi:MAG: glycosyltransferase family 4 protein [Deltaproteobacteria bacterium]|nr:glycosyltransferase family 4 protein [Deltaproteobacteria bacterium]